MAGEFRSIRKTIKTTDGTLVKLDLFGIEFQKKVDKKNKTVLRRTGQYGLRVYRNMVGKRRPAKPPEFTKTGKVSKRYIRWQERLKVPRPPYKVKGGLRNASRYEMDMDKGSVIAGPIGFDSSATPRVLEEGGTKVLKVGFGKNRRRKRVKFRSYPFIQATRIKTAPKFLSLMREVKLK